MGAEMILPPGAVNAVVLLVGLGFLVGLINGVLKIWDYIRPKSPCLWGEKSIGNLQVQIERIEKEQAQQKLEFDERLQRGTRAMKHIEQKIEDGLNRMQAKSEESDRRINERINQLSNITHTLQGVVKALGGKTHEA